MSDSPKKPVIHLVRSGYQPSKADLEEEIKLPEGTTSARRSTA